MFKTNYFVKQATKCLKQQNDKERDSGETALGLEYLCTYLKL